MHRFGSLININPSAVVAVLSDRSTGHRDRDKENISFYGSKVQKIINTL